MHDDDVDDAVSAIGSDEMCYFRSMECRSSDADHRHYCCNAQ